jgi:hypothetical protein
MTFTTKPIGAPIISAICGAAMPVADASTIIAR